MSLLAVSCPSVTLCVATDSNGSAIRSTDPANTSVLWQPEISASVGGLTPALACPSTTLCLDTGYYDPNIYYFNPAAASPPDPSGGLENVGVSQGVWCASASLCFANRDSSLLQSTNPTAGPSAWKVAFEHSAVADLSCAAEKLCVAASGSTGVIVGTPRPTASQIKALLRRQIAGNGRHARISALLKQRRYAFLATPPSAGRLQISWRAGDPRRTIAVASIRFLTAATKTVTIHLNPAGVRLLRASNTVRIHAMEAFTPNGSARVTAARS